MVTRNEVAFEDLPQLPVVSANDQVLVHNASDQIEYRALVSAVVALALSGGTSVSAPWSVSSTAPVGPNPGDGWYNTTLDNLSIWTGTAWELIGPLTNLVDTVARQQAVAAAAEATANAGRLTTVTADLATEVTDRTAGDTAERAALNAHIAHSVHNPADLSAYRTAADQDVIDTGKSDTGHGHVETDVTGLPADLTALGTRITTEVADRAAGDTANADALATHAATTHGAPDLSAYRTAANQDTIDAGKSNTSHGHVEGDVTGLPAGLAALDTRIDGEETTRAAGDTANADALATHAATTHGPTDLSAYRTAANQDTIDADKSNTGHNHVEGDVTGLPAGLTALGTRIDDEETARAAGDTAERAALTAHANAGHAPPPDLSVYRTAALQDVIDTGKSDTTHRHVEADVTDLDHDDTTARAAINNHIANHPSGGGSGGGGAVSTRTQIGAVNDVATGTVRSFTPSEAITAGTILEFQIGTMGGDDIAYAACLSGALLYVSDATVAPTSDADAGSVRMAIDPAHSLYVWRNSSTGVVYLVTTPGRTPNNVSCNVYQSVPQGLNGTDGTDGQDSTVPGPTGAAGISLDAVYQRSAVAPAAAPAGGTASGGQLTVAPAGTSLSPPVGTDPLYLSLASVRVDAILGYSDWIRLTGETGQAGTGSAINGEDEGGALGAFTSINFVGPGVTATLAGTELTVTIPGGGGGGGGVTVTDDMYFGLSADGVPEPGELTIAAVTGIGAIPTFVDMRLLIARLATEADISSVIFADDSTATNQFGVFTEYASTVIPSGETEEYTVWVSNRLLSQPSPTTMTVR